MTPCDSLAKALFHCHTSNVHFLADGRGTGFARTGEPVPAPTSVDEFLDLVRKSGVIDLPLLDSVLPRLSPEERGGEPKRMARALLREGVITRFQAEQFLQGKNRGFTIGHYTVLERIGTGGMALVYLCEHSALRRRVAVKILPTASAKDAEVLKRFYREARASAIMDHPNIVRAYDVDQDERHHYQVMEFVDGVLLHELVARFGPMEIHRAAHYVSQAAAGLQHAHEANLVHRDIKPNNLIVDRQGTVKILDMGLARIFSDSEEVLTRGILGTPDYLAPEQAKDSHHVDIRADIYGLGATFYFMLAGQPPFPEGSVAQKLLAHQIKSPTPVRQLRPEIPEEMAAVLDFMMAKDPAERYQLPAEVAEALAPWTQVAIPPPSEEELPQLSPALRLSAAHKPPPTPHPSPRPELVVAGHPKTPKPKAHAVVERKRLADDDTPRSLHTPPVGRKRSPAVMQVDEPPPRSAGNAGAALRWVALAIGLLVAAAGMGLVISRLLF